MNRVMNRVWIALGSNINNPIYQVRTAIKALALIPDTCLISCSSYYKTSPLLDPQDQPDFLNAAVALDTKLTPINMLDHIQAIEIQQGRIRTDYRFGPRNIDLDILLFGQQTISSSRLTVPHYAIHERAFMLYPLVEIAPNLCLPNGKRLTTILDNLPRKGIAFW